jgi:hypothetical protein
MTKMNPMSILIGSILASRLFEPVARHGIRRDFRDRIGVRTLHDSDARYRRCGFRGNRRSLELRAPPRILCE